MNTFNNSNLLFSKKDYDKIYGHLDRPVIIADHLRNADNMGALIRLADNIGALSLWFMGESKSVNQSKLRRAAASSFNNMPWAFTQEPLISKLIPEGYVPVALETSPNATNLYQTELPQKCALILGSEQYGTSDELINQAKIQVYIPIPGSTKSLNVSHAAAIFLFEWLRRQL